MSISVVKPTILVVDDTPENIQIIHGVLSRRFSIRAATSGAMALELAMIQPYPSLVLLDVMMPDMDGFQTCQQLKKNPLTCSIPIIFITARSDAVDEQTGFELGAVDYITKPINPSILNVRVDTHLALANRAKHLESLVLQRTQELENNRFKIIHRLGKAAEFRDNETGLHIIRMSHYSKMLAAEIGATQSWCELLFNASPMHDIGKIGIPDAILLKPGKLTEDERKIMQQHTIYGSEIIGDDVDPLLSMAKEIALNHHERWDGKGYPHGISQKIIPLSARIAAIADVFDALTSERPYKTAWSTEDAFKYLIEGAGQQFDPELIDVFINCKQQILQIKQTFSE